MKQLNTEKQHIANSRRRNQDSRVLEDAKEKISEYAAKTIQDGDVRVAILDLIGTDEDVMTSIVDSVSQVIVSKLLANESFIAKLADGLMKDGVLDAIKQNVYVRCLAAPWILINYRPNTDNKALREKFDSMEQYSRRNCLVVHGILKTKDDIGEAVPHVFNGSCESRPTVSTAVIA